MATAPSDDQQEFDFGEAGKQDGMDRAERNANPEFKEAAEQIIYEYAKCHPKLTVNVLWDGLELLGVTTHQNKAAGPVMLRCAKKGWIRTTNTFDTTNRATRHKAPVTVWESLICNQEAA